MRNQKILVTGALGMLGTELSMQIAQKKIEVHLILLDTAPVDVFNSVFQLKLGNPVSAVTYIQGDILDEKLMRGILSEVQIVYHLAGIVAYEKKQFERMFRVNVEGTALLTRLASELRVSKIIYASSISAVAACSDRDSTEEDYPLESDPAISQYSVSKIRAEKKFFAEIPNNLTKRVAANIGVIIGKGQPLGKVVNAIKGSLIFPYLKTRNSYIDVSDVASGLQFLEECGVDKERYILTSYNISNGEFTSEIVKTLGKRKFLVMVPSWVLVFVYVIASMFSRFISTDAWKSITVNKSYSTDKLRLLGWTPKLSLSESIKRLLST